MARFKDFGSGSSDDQKEPLVFKLHNEEFTCVPVVPGKTLLELISDSTSSDTSVQSASTLKFFRDVLVAESLDRFETLVSSKEKIVTLEMLTDVTAWLIEEYTARPLEQSKDS